MIAAIYELNNAVINDKPRELIEEKIAKDINEAVNTREFYKLGIYVLNEIFDKSDNIDSNSIVTIMKFGYEQFGVNVSALLPHIKCKVKNVNETEIGLGREMESILSSIQFIPVIREVSVIIQEMVKKFKQVLNERTIENEDEEGGIDIDWESEYKEMKTKYEMIKKQVSVTKQLHTKIGLKERNIEREEEERMDRIIIDKDINGAIEMFSKDPSLVYGNFLHKCAVLGWKDGIELVLDICMFIDGYVNKKDNNGTTALMFACNKGHLEVVEYLISKGANINERSNNGMTALIVASANGCLEVVKYLIMKGANVDEMNNDGYTSLIPASANGHLEVVKYLIMKGANIEAKNKYGATSLMLASANGKLEIIKYLMSKGANIEEKSKEGLTSLMLARQRGHLEVAEYLISNGARID